MMSEKRQKEHALDVVAIMSMLQERSYTKGARDALKTLSVGLRGQDGDVLRQGVLGIFAESPDMMEKFEKAQIAYRSGVEHKDNVNLADFVLLAAASLAEMFAQSWDQRRARADEAVHQVSNRCRFYFDDLNTRRSK